MAGRSSSSAHPVEPVRSHRLNSSSVGLQVDQQAERCPRGRSQAGALGMRQRTPSSFGDHPGPCVCRGQGPVEASTWSRGLAAGCGWVHGVRALQFPLGRCKSASRRGRRNCLRWAAAPRASPSWMRLATGIEQTRPPPAAGGQGANFHRAGPDRKRSNHGPRHSRPEGLFRSRPALGEGDGKEEARKPPGARDAATASGRHPLRPATQYEILENHRNRPGGWWNGVKINLLCKANLRDGFCLIRSGSCSLQPTLHLPPTAHAQRLLQPRAAAHPQVAGPPPARSTSCASPSTRGAHLDPLNLPTSRGSWSKLTIGLAKGRSCTDKRPGTKRRKDCDGKCAQPGPGFKPLRALAIPLSHYRGRGRGGGAGCLQLTRA